MVSFPAFPRPGDRLAHYELRALLGRGSTSLVFRALDCRLAREVAVKVWRRQGTRTRRRHQQLLIEARLWSQVSDAHVAQVFALERHGPWAFLVVELVTGTPLHDAIRRNCLTLPRILRHGQELALGLAAIHRAGIVHRDVKPANLRLSEDGPLKILDFGIAKEQWSDNSTTITTNGSWRGLLVGTLPYISPEQLRHGPADPRSDLFSAGAVLYELVAGRRAFPQRQPACLIDAILNREPEPLARIRPGLPEALVRTIERSLDKRIDERHQTAADLAADLRAVASSLGP